MHNLTQQVEAAMLSLDDRIAAVEAGVVPASALLAAPLLYRCYCLGYDRASSLYLPALEQAQADADRYYERWLTPDLDVARRQRIDQALADSEASGELNEEADVVRVVLAAVFNGAAA